MTTETDIPDCLFRKEPALGGELSPSSVEKVSNQVASASGTLDRPKSLRRVSFDSVQVHLCALTLGDNPSVSSGLPIALGEKQDGYIVDIDMYEEFERKSSGMKPPKTFSKEERQRIIREGGTHSRFAISQVLREVRKIRSSRHKIALDLLRGGRFESSSTRMWSSCARPILRGCWKNEKGQTPPQGTSYAWC